VKTRPQRPTIELRRSSRPQWPTVSVVIPTKNEAANLEYVIPLIPEWVTEVIVVDADSTDGTPERARELWPGARVIGQNARGKGSALSAGLCSATTDIVVMLDADGSMDPREIPAFVGALMAGADLAKGSRFAAGAISHDITPLRWFGNWGLKTAVNVLYRQHWSELAYGYAAMWTDILRPLGIDRIDPPVPSRGLKRYGHGFEIETLLFCRTVRAGLRVVEIAGVEYERIHGESNLNTFRDGFRALTALLRERFGRRSVIAADQQHPRPAVR
jgi:glycosyltransferase involved in cell wall biosynthesis